MIRAKSQYLPPDGKTSLETSYSATFKGQGPLQPADNKAVERRRIRSLYSEPYIDPAKQVRPHLSQPVVQIKMIYIRGDKGELLGSSCCYNAVKSHTHTILEVTVPSQESDLIIQHP